jgi:Ethanolamine utilization protein EutJ (predicted chaperonin)
LTGSGGDYAYALAIDNSGNVFVGGGTGNSSDFATNRVIYGTSGGGDAFVVKLSNDLNTLYRTVILTSDSDDVAFALAIDNSGNVFVGGLTGNSSNFATNRVIHGTTGWFEAFVVKLSNDLNTLYRTAILASEARDDAYALAIDNSGNVFVGGRTRKSSNFATTRVIYGTTGM